MAAATDVSGARVGRHPQASHRHKKGRWAAPHGAALRMLTGVVDEAAEAEDPDGILMLLVAICCSVWHRSTPRDALQGAKGQQSFHRSGASARRQ